MDYNSLIAFQKYLKSKISDSIKKGLEESGESVEQIVVKNDELYLIGYDLKNKSYGNFKQESKEKPAEQLTEDDMYEPSNLHLKIKGDANGK